MGWNTKSKQELQNFTIQNIINLATSLDAQLIELCENIYAGGKIECEVYRCRIDSKYIRKRISENQS
ncbi:unnamed protein product [Ceutorhynchus assimilis]|uniref:Uncharacterized protein n=1 Tax=Ceutorhynchus assimilis TaxID=467358 RepID=A0A9N9QH34_9CUCU|nr:unnamed protein product [Ceutorhynchus assimilis]